ncbi:hypothetical protein [uncultured Polaribacter sp.]|uniref:hypothetical protein n=1 Tax=uncultured Polaribacter sp. TaxID=174711 RepID=UPI00261560EB|nr:hypothetical protein [uncultured Polaribacter sp.]
MKKYKSFKEIALDLQKHKQDREAALKELKIVKSDFEAQLKPIALLGNFAKYISKYGFLMLLKKIFK